MRNLVVGSFLVLALAVFTSTPTWTVTESVDGVHEAWKGSASQSTQSFRGEPKAIGDNGPFIDPDGRACLLE